MANKKPILLYREGQDSQTHDVVQGTDVIDASHLAVRERRISGEDSVNQLEVVDVGGENYLFVPAPIMATGDNSSADTVRNVSGVISPHLSAAHSNSRGGLLKSHRAAPLAEPPFWADMRVGDTACLIPAYPLAEYKHLREDYITPGDTFGNTTMNFLGTKTTSLQEVGSMKYSATPSHNDTGAGFVNVDVHVHLKLGGTFIHKGPVTIKDLGALARTAGHYADKIVLHAVDKDGSSQPPTSPSYQTATILWATPKIFETDIQGGRPTLFVDTSNTLVLRWGTDIDYDTSDSYVVIRF